MNYNIFQKSVIGKKGKKVKRWYCWYVDNGIQRQIVCKNCSTKAEAMAFVSKLPSQSTENAVTKSVYQIARNMFLPGSDHMKRREAVGKPLTEQTMRDARGYVEQIIAKWGEIDITQIKVADVGTYLFGLKRSGSWKKRYITIFYEIFDEAAWLGVQVLRPRFPHFVCKQGNTDIFSSEELKKLFNVKNFSGKAVDAETVYLLFLVSAVAGLRIGEARAIRLKQFLQEKNALVIDGFLREGEIRTDFNKKGSVTDKKTRIVLIPEQVMAKIHDYAARWHKNAEDFLFTHENKPLRKEYLGSIFKSAIKKAGIDMDGRKLSPHSLRYTYVTKMRRTLPIETVRKLVGHTDDKMTDYYTRASLEDGLAGILGTKEAVENLFD